MHADGYQIRPYRDGDAEDLAQLCRAAIAQIGPHGYSAEQVAAWLARHTGPERYRERDASGAVIFIVADAQDTPAAYALLEGDGHLDHLYCHPDHSRRGLADMALNAAEQYARNNGIAQLYTEASELARSAFERAGYSVTQRREFEIDTVPIHNFAMVKSLD